MQWTLNLFIISPNAAWSSSEPVIVNLDESNFTFDLFGSPAQVEKIKKELETRCNEITAQQQKLRDRATDTFTVQPLHAAYLKLDNAFLQVLSVFLSLFNLYEILHTCTFICVNLDLQRC